MRTLALAALLAFASAGAAAPSQPQPVLVEFEGLLWVQSAEGLPYIKNGQILAPLLTLCDLFGAKCKPDWAKGTVQVQKKGQPVSTVPLAETSGQGVRKRAFVNLQAMSGPLGYLVTWREKLRRAKLVSGHAASFTGGGLYELSHSTVGRSFGYSTDVWSLMGVTATPVDDKQTVLELTSQATIPKLYPNRIWPLYRDASGKVGVLPAAECSGQRVRTCSFSVRQDWLYTFILTDIS